MSAPRVKRAFAGAASDPAQRQITNFFARDDDATAHHAATHGGRGDGGGGGGGSAGLVSSPAPLPPSVQADLLAVGMRVRKSVPEGYKTGKEAGGEGRRPARRERGGALRPAVYGGRELLPFCGIHRVGGLGVQEDGDTEPPSLTSSQETVSDEEMDGFPQPPPATTRKRLYGSHAEDDDDDDDDDDGAGEHTGGTLPTLQLSACQGRRVLAATPRRRQQQQQQQQQQHTQTLPFQKTDGHDVRIVGQENGGGDFDEAAFLDLSTWAGGQDLEMGGL